MRKIGRVLWLALGLAIGSAGTAYFRAAPPPVWAGNDRHEDYIMATGPIVYGPINATAIPAGRFNLPNGPNGPVGPNAVNTVISTNAADGIWLLDYRAGKLLGTIVDKNFGRVVGWAEVDLVQEFNIPPKQNVHFMMTTGSTINNNTALYLAEINTGRFGVYTMAPRADGTGGMVIRKHDMTLFRQPVAANP